MRTIPWSAAAEQTFKTSRYERVAVRGQSMRPDTPVDDAPLFRVCVETPRLRPQSVDQESGFWLWEGGRDLLEYISDSREPCWCERLGKSHGELEVLELGCGHGLPAIYLALAGHCARIDLQDHSIRVIQDITQANVWRNHVVTKLRHPPRFFAGDWQSWLRTASLSIDQKYDLILASETVYSKTSTRLCLQVCQRLLKPNGVALFAGKTVYFGLDGGLLELEDILKDLGGRARLLWQSDTNKPSCRREIQLVHFGNEDPTVNRPV
jgi:predicted nicotinamide N-methyase